MQYAGFIIEILKILVWPVIVIYILLRFNSPIKGLLENITSINFPTGSIQFREKLEEAKLIDKGSFFSKESMGIDSKELNLPKLIKLSPNAAILDAYREVELSLISYALHNNCNVRGNKGYVSGNAAVKNLEQHKKITPIMIAKYKSLKELRNIAISSKVNSNDAYEYILLASIFATEVRGLSKQYCSKNETL